MSSASESMDGHIERLFSGAASIGETHAVVAVRRGDVVVERYTDGVTADTTLRSWSMAKSVLHAAVGILVEEGALRLDDPAPVAAWSGNGDPRAPITLGHLMTMRSGLSWVEDPDPGERSDAVDLVYGNNGRPQPDTAAWSADRPLEADPGEVFRYSSGTSAIVAGLVSDAVGRGDDLVEWMHRRLFDPLAMSSPVLRFDDAGTWIGSSFCFATARDFARFGELYLAEGRWNDTRILSPDWVATARTETGRDELGRVHTCHWWVFDAGGPRAFFASGFRGQYLIVVPESDLVIVRLGDTPTERRGNVDHVLRGLIGSLST